MLYIWHKKTIKALGMDDTVKWILGAFGAIISILFGYALNSRKEEADELFTRLRLVEQEIVRIDGEIKPMAKNIDDIKDKVDKMLEIVTDIQIQAAANAKTGKTYLQDN